MNIHSREEQGTVTVPSLSHVKSPLQNNAVDPDVRGILGYIAVSFTVGGPLGPSAVGQGPGRSCTILE